MVTKTEPCGYCNGTGRVPGPRYDRDGRRRDDWPAMITCEYCGGAGGCAEGHKLLPASLPVQPDRALTVAELKRLFEIRDR